MKKLFISLFAIIAMISFTGCGEDQQQAQVPADSNIEQNEDVEIPEDVEPDELEIEEPELEEEDDDDYIGSWSRISSSLDGVPTEVVPCTVTMTEDTYISSTSVCTISGDLIVTDDIMDIIIDSSNCPGPAINDYVSTFKLTDDGEQLTFTNTQFGGTMVEVYTRIN